MGRGGHSNEKLGDVKRGGRNGCSQAVNGVHLTNRREASTRAPGPTGGKGEKSIQRSEGKDFEPRIL